MELYELLVRQQIADPSLQRRLASASAVNARKSRQLMMNIEARAAETIFRRSSTDLVWAGHLPIGIAQELSREMQLGRCVLGRKDRRASLRMRHPYITLAAMSARLRASIANKQPIPDVTLERWMQRVERALRQTRPAVFVWTANYDPAMRLVALAARRADIPVALYGHGISTPGYYLSLDDEISTHYLCWYVEEADEYAAQGVDSARVAVVGPLRARLGASGTRRATDIEVLLLGMRSQAPGYRDFLRRSFDQGRELGIKMAYRPHPLENTSKLSAVVPTSVILNSQIDIHDHVARSEWVVGGGSTALIEAKMDGAFTCFIKDMTALMSPSICAHLENSSDMVSSIQEFQVSELRNVSRNDVTYRSPGAEILDLVESGWFR